MYWALCHHSRRKEMWWQLTRRNLECSRTLHHDYFSHNLFSFFKFFFIKFTLCVSIENHASQVFQTVNHLSSWIFWPVFKLKLFFFCCFCRLIFYNLWRTSKFNNIQWMWCLCVYINWWQTVWDTSITFNFTSSNGEFGIVFFIHIL